MVLKIPELTRENQNWKIYCTHILDSAAVEGVVSHLTGAAPKPVDSHELEAWNSSNAVAKFIILKVITDSLLKRLVHHVTTVTSDHPVPYCPIASMHSPSVYSMYSPFPFLSICLVAPPIGERIVRSVCLYDYLICFLSRFRSLYIPVPFHY